MEEAQAMRAVISPGTGRRYPLTMICAVFRVPRSMVYRMAAPAPAGPRIAAKRGPKTAHSDAEVVAAIRAVLAVSAFHGEGYRKIRARLAHRGLAIGGKRVLRLMRVHHLLGREPLLEARGRLAAQAQRPRAAVDVRPAPVGHLHQHAGGVGLDL